MPNQKQSEFQREDLAFVTTTAVALLLWLVVFAATGRSVFAQSSQPTQPSSGESKTSKDVKTADGVNTRTNDVHETSTATNQTQTAQNITWSIGHPPERVRYPAQSSIPFTVSSGEKEVKDVRLAQSTLQDVATFFQIDANQLQLSDENGKTDAEIDIPANTTRRLAIGILSTFDTPGIFTGDIALRVAGKPETQSFKLTVYSRTGPSMALGTFIIALGLGLYFLVNVFLRRRIAIDDALLPAYQLRDTLAVLKSRANDAIALTQIPLPATIDALNQLDAQLKPEVLSARLPSITILPWSSAPAWQENLKAYLTPISDRAGALVVLVNSGIEVAVSYWTNFPAAVTAALGKIDPLAASVTNVASAQTGLSPILQSLYAAINPPHAAVLAPVLSGAPANIVARLFTLPPDTHTLEVRLARNTLWVWWIVALIALASGFYSVILQNFGFGAGTDYIKCFFWGLGFSVAGTQLDQLTQATVTGNFGITIPKA